MAAINGRIISDAHMTLLLNGGWAREFTGAVDGWYGAVDLAPGSYTIVIQDPHSGEQAQYGVVVRAGQVTSGP
jgi:hypothetical protein